MYLMYVDESGDCGILNSPTRYFILTGLVVHELRWRTYLDELINFRRLVRNKFGLRLREEFHAASLITHPGSLMRIKRQDRLTMIRNFCDKIAMMNDFSLICVVVDKQGKLNNYDVFEMAWKTLIQRFENTISRHNFPGPANPDERGIIFCDHTDDKKLFELLRKLRRYNPVPHLPQFRTQAETEYRNVPVQYIIEDPSFRDSAHSYFVQTADLAAFLLYQNLAPNAYIRKKYAKNYFFRLEPIFCRVASKEPYGIVRL